MTSFLPDRRATGFLLVAALVACDSSSGGTRQQQVRGVTVTPTSVTLDRGASFRFAASVDAAAGIDQSVSWRVTGGPSQGTIDPDGRYHAPLEHDTSAVTVAAISTADLSKLGTATVNFVPLSLTIEPH